MGPGALYLRTLVDALFFSRGLGTGPLSGLLTEPERNVLRTGFLQLVQQHQKVASRAAWVNDNADHPEWEERSARLLESSRRFGRMGDELAERAGMEVGVLVGLVDDALSPAPRAERERL